MEAVAAVKIKDVGSNVVSSVLIVAPNVLYVGILCLA